VGQTTFGRLWKPRPLTTSGQRAERCRLAADLILNQEDPAVDRLLALALAFESKAAALGTFKADGDQ